MTARTHAGELRDAVAAVVREQTAAERTRIPEREADRSRVPEREPERRRRESAGRGRFSTRVARMLDLS